MDGQYPSSIPHLSAYYPTGPPPMYPPEPFPPRLHQLQTMSMESLGVYSEYDDPNQAMLPPGHGQQRHRRRPPQGSEHVKHRRTRSGCYTCRQRRVKCDETHPMCDRCRKGKRECTYPGTEPRSASRTSRSGSKSKGSSDGGSSDSEDEIDRDVKHPLSAITDDEELEDESEPQSSTSDLHKSESFFANQSRHQSPTERPSGSHRNAIRPQTFRTLSKHSVKPSISQNNRWSTLPRDVRAYLKYHRDSMSYHHYGFKYDAGDFLKTTFLEIALNDDSAALLYGVVAFAAYHHALTHQEDIISRFLSYYNKSITLLQQALQKKRHNVATLLTILQLATIEEFLGDWTNLLGHQRAAHQILTDLFTPQTIMQDETRRRIISWYIRFDLFAGLMAGSETQLGREWFAACADFYTLQASERAQDLGARFEGYFSTTRLLATDVTLLFAGSKRGTISEEQFALQVEQLTSQIARTRNALETAFTEPSCFVQYFPKAPPPSDDDITDFRDPGFLYDGELFTMNFVLIDFWAIELAFKLNLATAQGQAPPPDLTEIALKKCKMFEAVQYYDQGPTGAVLGCQASLGIASLCVPKDKKHVDWCRRKFALIEQNGYIYPAALRQRMSGFWGVDVNNWWLPNDEGLPRVVRAIRDFIEYRASMPKDALAADVRDMSGILRSLNVSDDHSVPDDLKAVCGTDPETFDPTLDSSMSWESSPE